MPRVKLRVVIFVWLVVGVVLGLGLYNYYRNMTDFPIVFFGLGVVFSGVCGALFALGMHLLRWAPVLLVILGPVMGALAAGAFLLGSTLFLRLNGIADRVEDPVLWSFGIGGTVAGLVCALYTTHAARSIQESAA